ncbi:MAG: hypothetical protein JXX28_07550 [Deltaproteobacteria bacterium]|nr:hypothetical protein [Deltaproteobacteria bacterium]
MSGRLGRLARYLNFTLRPAISVPTFAAQGAGLYGALELLAGEPLHLGWRFALTAAVSYGLMVLIRLYDELKDADHDLARAAEGDPEYLDRPIVTGALRVEDVAWGRRWLEPALWILALPLGWVGYGAFAVAFAVTWLSFKWFFWPAVQTNRLLALLTHLPVYFFVVSGLFGGTFAGSRGLEAIGWPGAALLVGLWLANGIWETARKIRLPEEESGFQSYSSMIGWRPALILPAAFTVAALSLSIWGAAAVTPPGWRVAVGGAGVGYLGFIALLALRPSRALRALLRPLAEGLLALLWVGLPLALWWGCR